MVKYIVSMCLIGIKTRYDGTDALCERVLELVRNGEAVPFCPEQAGGLPTPRTPAEITSGDGHAVLCAAPCCDDVAVNGKTGARKDSELSVVDGACRQTDKATEADRAGQTDCGKRARVLTKDGVDVTAFYLRGAQEMLRLARAVGATKAVMKARSPSCGSGSIYDGTFSGNITGGDGVAAALLKQSGIEVMTEDDFINAFKDAIKCD